MRPTMPPVNGGRPGIGSVASAETVSRNASSGSPPVGTPTGGSPIQWVRPSFSVSTARQAAPPMGERDPTPPSSADSSRKGPAAFLASLRYTPTGVSASASSLRTTGMTRRVRARSVNVSSEGHVRPNPRLTAGLGVWLSGWTLWADSLIRGWLTDAMSLDRAQMAVVEAGSCAGVAGRADLIDPDKQRVAVAVQRHGLDVLRVARGVALAPVLAATAGPERHPARRQGAMKSLIVHPADHEHLTAVVLLDDGTHQSVAVALQARCDLGGQVGL